MLFDTLQILFMAIGGLVCFSVLMDMISKVTTAIAEYLANLVYALSAGYLDLRKKKQPPQPQPQFQNHHQQQNHQNRGNPNNQQHTPQPSGKNGFKPNVPKVVPKVETGIRAIDSVGERLTQRVNESISEMERREKR